MEMEQTIRSNKSRLTNTTRPSAHAYGVFYEARPVKIPGVLSMPTIKVRSLKEIAAEIKEDWGSAMSGIAAPYVEAMSELDTLHDRYHLDSAVEMVSRFIGVAGTWRGPVAKRVKAELKAMLALHLNPN